MTTEDGNKYLSRKAEVIAVVERQRVAATVNFANNRIVLESENKTVLDVTYSDVKKIRVLDDGFLIYIKSKRLPTHIYFALGHEGDELLHLKTDEYEKIGMFIEDWKLFLRHTPIRLTAFSWPIFISLSLLYFVIVGIFLKKWSVVIFIIFCLVYLVLHKREWRKL